MTRLHRPRRLVLAATFALFSSAACEGSDPGASGSDDTSGSADTQTGESGDDGPALVLLVDVDETLPRLDNAGQPVTELPAGHAAQNPRFRTIAASHGELVPNAVTPLGQGTELFDSPEREGAHDFDAVPKAAPGETLIRIPIADITPGSYAYLRMAVAFQRYEVEGHAEFMGIDVAADIDIASFLDDQLYISAYEIGDTTVELNEVKSQGYFGAWSQYTGVTTGQVPTGATTVPNPLDATSPIPVESCVVTGIFETPFVITGDESEDITLHVTMSTNQSFEWTDTNQDGLWQPLDESVADMGLRGMTLAVD